MKTLLIGILGFLTIGLLFPLPSHAAGGPTAPPIQTSFGGTLFPTDISGVIGRMFGILLGASAIIALGLIIFSGFRLSLSQGNQEKVQAAREMLTAAIAGLMFIIFSTVILQVIGVDVLGLPSFNK